MAQTKRFSWAIPITLVALAATLFIPSLYQRFIGIVNPQAAGGRIASISISKTTVKVNEKFTIYGSLPGTDLRVVGVTIANKMNGYSKMYPVALTKTKNFSFEATVPQKGAVYVIYLWRTTSPTPQLKDQIQTSPMPLYLNVIDTRISADLAIDENTTIKPSQHFTLKGKVYNYRPTPQVTMPRITQPPIGLDTPEAESTLFGREQTFEIRISSKPLNYDRAHKVTVATDGTFTLTTSIPQASSYSAEVLLNGTVLPHALVEGLATTSFTVQ